MARVKQARNTELIKIKLTEILRKEITDPILEGVTIVDVKVSPDVAQAKVYFACYSNDQDIGLVTETLNNTANFIQSKLSKTLRTRNIPRIKFIYDQGFDYSDHIDRILKKIDSKKE